MVKVVRKGWTWIVVIGMLGVFVVSGQVLALTDAERLQLLEDRFLKGEISEKAYYELKAKYEGGKKETKKGTGESTLPVKEIPGNVIKNASFEIDSDENGIPDGWKKVAGGTTKMTLDNTTVHSGKLSAKIKSTQPDETSEWFQEVAVEGGKTYLFKCWYKSQEVKGGHSLAFAFYYTPIHPKYKDWITWAGDIRTRDWTLYEKKIEVPGGVTKVRVRLLNCGQMGTVWFDDVYFGPAE